MQTPLRVPNERVKFQFDESSTETVESLRARGVEVLVLGNAKESYKGWHIQHDPPPIPSRSCDWQFVHEDYDGPEDSRCGFAPSLEAAKAEIDIRCSLTPGKDDAEGRRQVEELRSVAEEKALQKRFEKLAELCSNRGVYLSEYFDCVTEAGIDVAFQDGNEVTGAPERLLEWVKAAKAKLTHSPPVIDGHGQRVTAEQDEYLIEDKQGAVHYDRMGAGEAFAEGYRYMRCPTFPPREPQPAFVAPERPELVPVRWKGNGQSAWMTPHEKGHFAEYVEVIDENTGKVI